MRRYFYFIWFLFFPLILSCSADKKPAGTVVLQTEVAPPPPFVLGAGDQVELNVWRQDDLNRTITITPSGNISIPLAGEIRASGLTISQLREKITVRLSKYFVNPKVDVALANLSSRNVYVLGEVTTPGAYVLTRRISALEAITMAKGFTEDANQTTVLLLRAKEGQAEVAALNLDIRELAEEGLPIQNVYLKNRDVIYVPPLKIVDLERFMRRLSGILSPILEIQRSALMWTTTYDILMGKDVPTGVVY